MKAHGGSNPSTSAKKIPRTCSEEFFYLFTLHSSLFTFIPPRFLLDKYERACYTTNSKGAFAQKGLFMKRRLLAFVLISATILCCLVGCKKQLDIHLDGGSIAEEKIEDMQTLLSTKPTKEGYDFAGWYADAGYTQYMTPSTMTKDQEKARVAYAKWIKVESKTYDVRQNQITVTDGGRENNPIDIIYLSDDYNLTDLSRAGYTELEIKISMQISEKDDGYQHIFLYKNETVVKSGSSVLDWLDKNVFGNEEDDPAMLFSYAHEHDPGIANHVWDDVSFQTRVKISDLEKDLFLRYGASGTSDDTWYNQNVVVTVTPKK